MRFNRLCEQQISYIKESITKLYISDISKRIVITISLSSRIAVVSCIIDNYKLYMVVSTNTRITCSPWLYS